MNFNKHSNLEGLHAFLGASKYHWVNYDDEKLAATYISHQAKMMGTKLHEVAKDLIDLAIKLPKTNKTLNLYVNDAIGFKMKTEVVLFYSFNCFCTADAILFKKNKLRIHDLKTGVTKASFKQLEINTAVFCLEYDVDPNEIEIELRIYQNDDVEVCEPFKEDILYIMDKIVKADKHINNLKLGVEQ